MSDLTVAVKLRDKQSLHEAISAVGVSEDDLVVRFDEVTAYFGTPHDADAVREELITWGVLVL
jgi:uncharacterized protein with von Willebrand factor type A (vWA) domain